MATLTVRGFDDELHRLLRIRAARNGRSMESEVRDILAQALTPEYGRGGLGSRIHARFAAIGGADLDLPSRDEPDREVTFDE